jgi:bacteriocin biosynthesis cyclodehydratase domain-containing protein
VVLVEPLVADSVAAGPLLSTDTPHLSVLTREGGVVVGPLVVPGQGPCLRCLDLHRRDRDPQWPSLVVQLLAGRPGNGGLDGLPGAARSDPIDTATTTLAAGLAALQVLSQLDGERPAAVGCTLEIEPPDGLVARRPWPVHPHCGCQC